MKISSITLLKQKDTKRQIFTHMLGFSLAQTGFQRLNKALFFLFLFNGELSQLSHTSESTNRAATVV